MPPRQRTSILGACFLPAVALGLLAIIFLAFLPSTLARQAETTFGPPSPSLSSYQRFRLSITLTLNADALTQAHDPDGAPVEFTVAPGEPVPSIAQRLWEANLISDPDAFRSYLVYTGLDTRLKSGEFTLSAALSPVQIAQEMQSSISAEVALVILAGWRMEEVAASLPTTGLEISAEEFLQATRSVPEGYSFSPELSGLTLEGFLFPGSYPFPRQVTLQQVLTEVLLSFETQVDAELRAGFANQGLSLLQAVTLASIVEREAIVEDEMPLIASVFYNRMAISERLASDPTVQYALGYNAEQGTWWTNPLSLADLEVDSPYNTYLYTTLPPGPICNPGLAALRAVAFPAQTPYYYFRAACDNSGLHLFAESYAEHLANECP